MPCRLPCLLLIAAVLFHPSDLGAQFGPLTVPRGTVGVELLSRFTTWDQRYRNGLLESAGADFARSAIGVGLFPSLSGAEERLARLTGLTGPILNAGRYGVSQLTSVGEFGLGLQVGVTARLTLSGLVPFQRVRVQTIGSIDSTAAVSGFNPADPVVGSAAGAATTQAFFQEFDTAIAALSAGLANGTWAGDPALQALAQATLAEAESVRGDLHGVLLDPLTRSPFIPLAGSAPGMLLLDRITQLQSRFADGLGITGFTQQPALPAARPAVDDWNRFLADGAGPVSGSLGAPIYTALGDVEIGAAYLVVDHGFDAPGGTAVRLALRGTARLRTSQLDDPDRLFDIGTGDRQPDGEVALVADLARGRAAVRLAGWYTHQFPGTQERRVGPPEDPYQSPATLAVVEKDPGDVVGIAVLPAYRFTPRFAFLAGVEWWSRGEDRYRWAEGQAPLDGIDPNVLSEGVGARAWSLRLGLTWSHPGGTALRPAGAPLDATVTWERVMGASGGRVPRTESVRAGLRVYARFW
jgi:hypothetical protein